jgi:hypothetical protein
MTGTARSESSQTFCVAMVLVHDDLAVVLVTSLRVSKNTVAVDAVFDDADDADIAGLGDVLGGGGLGG